MIELPRPPFDLAQPRIKVFGIGNAGSNALDRVVLDGASGVDLVAINTDAQVLASSVTPHKLQIGQTITRGLGAGGDPDLGRTAAEEGIGEILANLTYANIVILVVGLGGGTGSGAAPVIAEVAREHGAMIIVVATIPFAFEGKRRLAQAEASLAALRQTADVLICYENDRMGEAVGPTAPIQEAFAIADRTISQSVRALASFAGRKGLVHTSFDELITAFRGEHIRSFFGCGEASGDNRAHEALEWAFGSPLLNRTRMKEEADCVVVSICGGTDLTLNEVQILMEEFQHHVREQTRVFFGVTIDPSLTGRFTVSILASVEVAAPAQATTHLFPSNRPQRSLISAPTPEPAAVEEPESVYYEEAPVDEEIAAEPLAEQEAEPEPEPEPTPSYLRPRPGMTTLRSTISPRRPGSSVPPARVPRPVREGQPESANRGRFEKSEPTIIDGQDLDVPSFLRRNLNTP